MRVRVNQQLVRENRQGGRHEAGRPRVARFPRMLIAAGLLALVVCLQAAGCSGQKLAGDSRPSDGVSHMDVAVSMDGGTATAGPFPQLIFPKWVNAEKLVAMVRHDGGESLAEFCRSGSDAWTGRILLTLNPDSQPGSFYTWDYLGEGKSILFSSGACLWRYDIPSEPQTTGQMVRVADGVRVFKVSPDRTRVVAYTGQEARMVDLRDGGTTSLIGVPSYEFPFTGLACSWSPDSSLYLYQVILGPCMTSFGIVEAGTGKVIRTVAPEDGSAFWATWSPDGAHVAFLYLRGRGDEFLEHEVTPPVAHKLGILDVRTGEVAYVAVPEKLIYGMAAWCPTGDRLAFAAGTIQEPKIPGFEASTAIYVTYQSGAEWRIDQVTPEQDGIFQFSPSWSPTGKTLAFVSKDREDLRLTLNAVRASESTGGSSSWTSSISLGETTGTMAWLDDRTLAVVAITPRRQCEIRLVSVADGTVSVLENAPVSFVEMALSPDGRYLAWVIARPRGENCISFLKIRPVENGAR